LLFVCAVIFLSLDGLHPSYLLFLHGIRTFFLPLYFEVSSPPSGSGTPSLLWTSFFFVHCPAGLVSFSLLSVLTFFFSIFFFPLVFYWFYPALKLLGPLPMLRMLHSMLFLCQVVMPKEGSFPPCVGPHSGRKIQVQATLSLIFHEILPVLPLRR